MEWRRGEFFLTDDRKAIEVTQVHRLVSNTYWARGQTLEVTEQSMANSLCVGLSKGGELIGFARAVTDQVTFTWICDVVIDESHRGSGLGKWMVECLINHPKLQTRSQVLATDDAHPLYEPFGFKRVECMKRKPSP